MNASNIVSALLEGRPKKRPGASAEPLIQAWIDSCGGDEAALQKIKPRYVRAACICARAVLPKVPEEYKQACIDAIEAAEAWASEPSEENRLKADKAGAAGAAWAARAVGAAAWDAWAAAGSVWAAAWAAAWVATGAAWAAAGAARYAYEADPSINFPAWIAAKMAEYPTLESLV